MNFDIKQRLYKDLDWLIRTEKNSENSHLFEKKLFELFKVLVDDSGYNISTAQAAINRNFRNEEVFLIHPFDFTAFNKKDKRDFIGILFRENRYEPNRKFLNPLLHNAHVQNCPRTIVVSRKSIEIPTRAEIFMSTDYRVEFMDLLFLKGWLDKIETSIDDINEVKILFQAINDRLAKLIAEYPDKLIQLEWRDVERLLAHVLSEFGFEVILTPGSKDGGKDIILNCYSKETKKSYIIEVKHWNSKQKVGHKLIRDFINVIINENRHQGLYISTFGFTDNAFESLTTIDRKLVRFGEQNKIQALCNQYQKIRSGIWTPYDREKVLFELTI